MSSVLLYFAEPSSHGCSTCLRNNVSDRLSPRDKTALVPPPPNFRLVADERFNICDICSKCFKSKTLLLKHHRVHSEHGSEQQGFKCTMCPFTCVQPDHLRTHLSLHVELGHDGSHDQQPLDSSEENSEDSMTTGGEEEENVDVDDDTLDGDVDDEEEEEQEEEDEKAGASTTTSDEEPEPELKAEDLSVKTPAPGETKPAGDVLGINPSARSLLGELMDKCGFSQIHQYKEAYKQALKESRIGGGLPSSASSFGVFSQGRTVLSSPGSDVDLMNMPSGQVTNSGGKRADQRQSSASSDVVSCDMSAGLAGNNNNNKVPGLGSGLPNLDLTVGNKGKTSSLLSGLDIAAFAGGFRSTRDNNNCGTYVFSVYPV